VDPTGLSDTDVVNKEPTGSFGYVNKSDSVEGAGHSGGWVENLETGKFDFFQLTAESEVKDGKILSDHGKGVLQQVSFDSKDEMLDYLGQNGFDRFAEFSDISKTNLDKMVDKVNTADKWFGNYNLVDNNCADFVNKVAEAGGIKGMAGWYPNTNFDQIYKMQKQGQYNITIQDSAKNWRYSFDILKSTIPTAGTRADLEDIFQVREGR